MEGLGIIPESGEVADIANRVVRKQRISVDEAKILYEKADLNLLGALADLVRQNINGKKTYFIKNMHLEPTNICVHNCKFCSYRRRKNEDGSWEMTIDEMLDQIQKGVSSGINEIHIVGGTHPEKDLNYYGSLLKSINQSWPELHIKAFTAVEIEFMSKNSGCSVQQGLQKLKKNGLMSMPGGGAEIFLNTIREQICPDKISGERWLEVHETAHLLGIPTNATMLYGHIEKYEHRVDHLDKLRKLQDNTRGFNCFIPLKYKKSNNPMYDVGEVSLNEDLRNYAVSRIFLDNFNHIKAYWPMIGKKAAQLALKFGVDDFDGTIEDSTRIYSMAGAEDNKPSMTTIEIVNAIKNAGLVPVERDALYNAIRSY